MASVHALFDLHADFVWRALARAGVADADLKDALQDVFITAASKIDQTIEGTKLSTWLYAIAIRVAANYRRKVSRRREVFDETSLRSVLDTDQSPEDAATASETRVRLAQLLERLDPEERLVFEMFELDEMTCQAIAKDLGISVSTAYVRLRAARKALESGLEQIEEVAR